MEETLRIAVEWLHVLGGIFGLELIGFFAIFTAVILMRFGL